MYSGIAKKASKDITRIVNTYHFDTKFMPFKIVYKDYLISNPLKIDLLFHFYVEGVSSIGSIVLSKNILNGSFKVESVDSKHHQIAVLDNNTERKFILNEKTIKYIFLSAFESLSDNSYIFIKEDLRVTHSELQRGKLERDYKDYKDRTVSKTVYPSNETVGEISNIFTMNLNVDTHVLTLFKQSRILEEISFHHLLAKFANRKYGEIVEEKSVEVKINCLELKRYFYYHKHTGHYLGNSALIHSMQGERDLIYPLFNFYGDTHLLNDGMMHLYESMLKKPKFSEIWTDFPTVINDNKDASNKNDLVLEKLEYAIGLNPSPRIKDELDKMKSDYIAEKEAEIKRKEQEKRDTEAERILITLKNYYVRGESIEEERIN